MDVAFIAARCLLSITCFVLADSSVHTTLAPAPRRKRTKRPRGSPSPHNTDIPDEGSDGPTSKSTSKLARQCHVSDHSEHFGSSPLHLGIHTHIRGRLQRHYSRASLGVPHLRHAATHRQPFQVRSVIEFVCRTKVPWTMLFAVPSLLFFTVLASRRPLRRCFG